MLYLLDVIYESAPASGSVLLLLHQKHKANALQSKQTSLIPNLLKSDICCIAPCVCICLLHIVLLLLRLHIRIRLCFIAVSGVHLRHVSRHCLRAGSAENYQRIYRIDVIAGGSPHAEVLLRSTGLLIACHSGPGSRVKMHLPGVL